MTDKTEICLICLRTDKKLNKIDTKLSDFHHELCAHSVSEYNTLYCLECEYLLQKTYKFKVKCLKAMEILKTSNSSNNWNMTPLSLLCTLLPKSCLNFWTMDNAQIYSFVQEEPWRIGGDQSACDTEDVRTHDLLVNSLPNDDIKLENDESNTCLKDIFFKTEDTTHTFEEILFKSDSDVENDIKEIDSEVNDIVILNDHIVNDDDDDDDDKLIYLKNKCAKKNKEKRRSANKRSFDKDTRSQNEISGGDVKKRKIVRKEKDSSKRTVAKKNKDSNSNVAKENAENMGKKTRFHTRKAIIAELTNIDAKEMNGNVHSLKHPFTKERLKEEIKSKFASCGELIAADGTIIDKAFVLNCLEDKVTEFVMKQLFQSVYRKTSFKPKALKLFKSIQNKYKTEYDSVFDIEYLNTKDKMIGEFEKRKTYPSYVTAEFKCEICYQGFKHEKKLLYHKKCHDESAGEMICAICKVRHRSTKSLINHMNAHEAVYRCKLCPLITYHKNSMQNHYQQHKGVKYTCKECNTMFGSMSAFRTHVSYRHARGHVCTACGRAYSTRVGLRAHHTRDHQRRRQMTCPQCALTFASSEAYHKHLRVTHKQALRGRPPSAFSALPTAHRPRNETRPRRRPVMTCRLCSAVGSSWGWLSLHFSMEHPTADLAQLYADKHTHLCDVCGKSFSTVYTLQAHLNVHSGSRPFACTSCSARFHRAMSLRLHALVHTPPSKPCATCGKRFRSTSNLYNHMRSHIGDRRYKCDICGKGFIHRCSLNEHVRGVHKNIRRVRKRGVTDTPERGH